MSRVHIAFGVGFASVAGFAVYKLIKYAAAQREASADFKPSISRETMLDILTHTYTRTQQIVATHEAALKSIADSSAGAPQAESQAAANDLLRQELSELEMSVAREHGVSPMDLHSALTHYVYDPATADPTLAATAHRTRKILAKHVLTRQRALEAFRYLIQSQLEAIPDIVRSAVDAFGGPSGPKFQQFISEAMQSAANAAVQSSTGFNTLVELQTAVATKYASDTALAAEASAVLHDGMDAVNGSINKMLQQMLMSGELQM